MPFHRGLVQYHGEVSRQSSLLAARLARGHAQADGSCQSCLPVVVGHECGRSQDKRSGHVQGQGNLVGLLTVDLDRG
jgi:hypothetical protein